MEISAIQSSPSASTMGIPEPIWLSCRNDYGENDDELFAQARREDRKSGADDFRNDYIFGRCMDQKTCIWRGDSHSWSEASSGITWVGVHGNESICVVTKAEVLDVTRVHGHLQFVTIEDVEPLFRKTMISEMEDLADPASKPHEMRDKSINKPFGVVSVVPVTNKVHDASGDSYEDSSIVVKYKMEYLDKFIKNGEVLSDTESEVDMDAYIRNDLKQSIRRKHQLGILDTVDSIWFLKDKLKMDAASPMKEAVQESSEMCDERRAIEFLEKEMEKSAEHFTKEETIKTAISAFQRLFNKKLEAKEIGVCVMDPNYLVLVEEVNFRDPYAEHLEENEIEKYLSDMSEPESEGSCSSPTPKRLKCFA